MTVRRKNIISLAIVLIPFYLVALLQKIFYTQDEILVEEYLGIYMLLGLIGISTIILLNKYLLRNKMSIFRAPDSKLILDIALALLLLGIYYFIKSIEISTYGEWIKTEIDRTAIDTLLAKIFSNTLFSIIIVGPFSWINEGFTSLSVAFILYNFWEIGNKKIWIWATILFTSIFIGLIQYNNGIPSVINSSLIIVCSSYIYYRYRSIFPLFIAGILHQTIDLVGYWVYI